MKIQILISKDSWANDYINYIKKRLKKKNVKIVFLDNYNKLKKKFDLNIAFSYFKKIPYKYFEYSKYNLVCHESNLPKGRGMSPLTWQLLKNKKKITFSLIDLEKKMDTGCIYLQKKVKFKNDLLFNEIKYIQVKENINMIIKFLELYKRQKLIKRKQVGTPSYYPKRSPKLNEIDINKSIKDQFNLIRLSDNKFYQNYFFLRNKKYFLKIYKK